MSAPVREAPLPASELPHDVCEFQPRGVTQSELCAMRAAFELAGNGPVQDANPRVGCVILSPRGTVLAEGWHEGAGTPHAEAVALSQASSQGVSVVGATAVVSLEPCSHTGRTPSCAQALINAGVTRVLYAIPDPTPTASGGARMLRNAGVEVLGGILSDAGEALIAPWRAPTNVGGEPQRNRIVVKWASTLDGKVAAPDGTSQWITGESARQHAHALRAEVDVLAVGTGTALADDPRLTARGEQATRTPLRVVVGNRPLPETAQMYASGASVLHVRSNDPHAVARALDLNSAKTTLIDGGPRLVSAFIRAGLADELHVYLAPKLLGAGLPAVQDLGVTTLAQAHEYSLAHCERLGDDVFLRFVRGGTSTQDNILDQHHNR